MRAHRRRRQRKRSGVLGREPASRALAIFPPQRCRGAASRAKSKAGSWMKRPATALWELLGDLDDRRWRLTCPPLVFPLRRWWNRAKRGLRSWPAARHAAA